MRMLWQRFLASQRVRECLITIEGADYKWGLFQHVRVWMIIGALFSWSSPGLVFVIIYIYEFLYSFIFVWGQNHGNFLRRSCCAAPLHHLRVHSPCFDFLFDYLFSLHIFLAYPVCGAMQLLAICAFWCFFICAYWVGIRSAAPAAYGVFSAASCWMIKCLASVAAFWSRDVGPDFEVPHPNFYVRVHLISIGPRYQSRPAGFMVTDPFHGI